MNLTGKKKLKVATAQAIGVLALGAALVYLSVAAWYEGTELFNLLEIEYEGD